MANSGEGFHDEWRAALEKVLHSRAFSKSDSSRLLLEFVVEKLLSGNVDNIKEYTIATEALGRRSDFDPKADSIVRIQMQRLRKRLEEYYEHEGARDPFKMVIPSGRYVPEFRSYPGTDPPHGLEGRILPDSADRVAAGTITNARLLLGLLAVLLCAVVIMAAHFIRSPASGSHTSGEKSPMPDSLSSLWRLFVRPNDPPLIVYSNALYLADEYGGFYKVPVSSGNSLPTGAKVTTLSGLGHLSPFLPSVGDLHYCDLYTGTGEVVAAAKIARLLASAGQDFSVERSGLTSYDDIRSRNVIFLGASMEDPVLAKLPEEAELAFDMPFGNQPAIRDRHPTPGQPGAYNVVRDQATGEFQTDYALLSLLPGVDSNHYVLVIGGITTLGTQAAAEFATSPTQMATLEKMCEGSGSVWRRSPYFQSLLSVQIRSGTIARIDCLIVREIRHK